MVRELQKSYACIGCDYIIVRIGWPCNKCPRQGLGNPDMHSQANATGNATGKLKRRKKK